MLKPLRLLVSLLTLPAVIFFAAACTAPAFASAPKPSPAPASLDAPRSPHYRVERLSADGRSVAETIFTHFSVAQKPDSNLAADASWSSLEINGRTTIRVTNLRGDFTRARVLPSSRGIAVHVEGRTAIFELDRPSQIAVEFDEGTTHPLFIFADPPEKDIPSPHDPNVIYFGPGSHELGEKFIEPKAGQTVYLAPGAIVHARIKLTNAPHVTIRGRGILRGGHLPANPPNTYTVPQLIETDYASHHTTVEGLTLVESPHYNVLIRSPDGIVRNIKTIGWWFGTDGIGTNERGLVEDCFIRGNDDAIKLYNHDMTVRRCVIWQMENGAPFQISWNMNNDNSRFRVSDIDIIRVDHNQAALNRAIFNSIHGGSAHLSDYVFENIRIENANYRFMLLQIKKTRWAKAKEWGRLSNLTFRNITADGPFRQRSAIRSDDPAGRIDGVTFENVRIGGKLITSAEDAQLDIDPATTSDIRFLPGR